MNTRQPTLRDRAGLDGKPRAPEPYSTPKLPGPIDLFLDANEGPRRTSFLCDLDASALGEACRRYPDATALERAIAQRHGVEASRVLVTSGGDDAIDRACRVAFGGDRCDGFPLSRRELILPVPTFEMIARSAHASGAAVVSVPWDAASYPLEEVLARIGPRTAMIAAVSPNNPTGAIATSDQVRCLAQAAPGALLLIDLAYTEFADDDLTDIALELPNAVIVRTFSKAMGLAGCRVGYAMGSSETLRTMRAAGSPYPVSGLGLMAARKALAEADKFMPDTVQRVRTERAELATVLRDLGVSVGSSQANFVLAERVDAGWVWRALGGLGVAVRRFAGDDVPARLRSAVRVSCPCDQGDFERLCGALRAALRPQALLLDMDGVLADVSGSYRRVIAMTAESFGVRVTPEDIEEIKAQGNANNDWIVTQRLVERKGVRAELAEVTKRFERLYMGDAETPGLQEQERLIPALVTLEALARRIPLGIVTGRPRRDCRRFLERFGLSHLFRAVVCMEDAPAKPDPAPVSLALSRLGVRAAWMVGDTPDDLLAARRAGVVPIGFCPPGSNQVRTGRSLEHTGVARVLNSLDELLEMLL